MRRKVPKPTAASQTRIATLAREAFLRQGYDRMTMVALAEGCGLTRRGLYYYFSSKEEAFRAMIRLENEEALQRGREALERALSAKRPTALNVIAMWMDARYGHTRRSLGKSAFAKQINDAAFAVCGNVMNQYAGLSNEALANLLQELRKRGLLRLQRAITPDGVAVMLADGARGINQVRPPMPDAALSQRYRDMAAAILYGMAKRSA